MFSMYIMDLLFRKRNISNAKPQLKLFSKMQPAIAPSLIRKPLIGVGGAGIRKPAVM